MSTLKSGKNSFDFIPPPWTTTIPEFKYHNDALSGIVVTSSMLQEFSDSPALYYALIKAYGQKHTSPAFSISKAIHRVILARESVYRRYFTTGEPLSQSTGRSFISDTRALANWIQHCGLDTKKILAPVAMEDINKMRESVAQHHEAGRLLTQGWAELSSESEVEGVLCRARFDWLHPDGVILGLNTVTNLTSFRSNARKLGYLNHLAFCRTVAHAAGSPVLKTAMIAVEKNSPFRVSVWHVTPEELEPYSRQNQYTLQSLRTCRHQGAWPAGEGKDLFFFPNNTPPSWLN